MKPTIYDKYIGYGEDRKGNLWELYQQSNNLYIGRIISKKLDNTFEDKEQENWFVISKGVLEVM
jgi:hypothetical protein